MLRLFGRFQVSNAKNKSLKQDWLSGLNLLVPRPLLTCYTSVKLSSCWIVEQEEFAIMMCKTGDLTITEDVRFKPLGRNRRRGRPKRLLVNPTPPMAPMAYSTYKPHLYEHPPMSPPVSASPFSDSLNGKAEKKSCLTICGGNE